MKRLLPVALVVAACEPAPARFVYRFADSDGGQCASDECSDIPFACDAFMQVRIIRPSDPVTPLYSFCKEINANSDENLCAIATADFDEDLVLPLETLQVQALVWPSTEVRLIDGEFVCPPGADVQFDAARGFPVQSQTPSPAAGGSTFFGPDDEEVVIDIDCTNLELANAVCAIDETISVTTTLLNFDTLISVEPGQVAARYFVSVGEPTLVNPDENTFALPAGSTTVLPLVDRNAPMPTWAGEIDRPPLNEICIRVIGSEAQATATIQCVPVPTTEPYLLSGVALDKSTLDEIVAALGTALPGTGITIGIVLDQNFAPVEGAVVTGPEDVRYLSGDRTSVGNVATSSNGIFISQNADFRQVFTTQGPDGTAEAIGGSVDGTVTIVLLQAPGL